MKIFYRLIFLLFILTSCEPKIDTLYSPDKNIKLCFELNDQGIPYYSIYYKNDTIITSSKMGIRVVTNPLDSGLRKTQTTINKNIAELKVTSEMIDSTTLYNEMIIKVEKNSQEMDLIFRLYNQGAAIRYWLKGVGNTMIEGDITEIRFPHNQECFWAPADKTSQQNYFLRSDLDGIKYYFENAKRVNTNLPFYPDSMYLSLPLLSYNQYSKFINIQHINCGPSNQLGIRLSNEKRTLYSGIKKGTYTQQVISLPYSSQWLSIAIAENANDLLDSTFPTFLESDNNKISKEEYKLVDSFGNCCNNNVLLPFFQFFARGNKDELNMTNTGEAHATLAHQLALPIILNQPYRGIDRSLPLPKEVKPYITDLFKSFPPKWDIHQTIDCQLGSYVVLARKDGYTSNWHIAAINDMSNREVDVSFDFLENDKLYKMCLLEDTPKSHWITNKLDLQHQDIFIRKGHTMTFHLAKGGGFAAILREVKNP